jgi:hypothetical protein
LRYTTAARAIPVHRRGVILPRGDERLTIVIDGKMGIQVYRAEKNIRSSLCTVVSYIRDHLKCVYGYTRV